MEHLGALNAFVQTAEAGGFAPAAARLGLSASAVGKAVARLEDRLAVRLFHRSTRSLTLTPEGAMFLDRCRRIFSEIEAAEIELSRTRRAPSGTLRVSLPLIGMLMMPAVMAFMRAYPEITLDLDFTDRLVDVIEEGFDAVIRTGEARDSRLMMRRLGAFSHRIVASPDYLAARGTPRAPEDLLAHACLHHRYPTTGKLQRWPLVRDGADLDLALPVTAVASTLEPQLCLAEEGFGLACLPLFAVQRFLRRGALVAVLRDHLREVGAFHILWPASRHPSPKLAAFVAFMGENLLRETDPLRCRQDVQDS
ncbi:transcriptional regulator, LysR family [Methylobacterium sp. 4-46]|uniref:LysR family transcriptional regulator n=1 Tax=unclassified Methylobacterium TaxID=2615210 RepID=UPI000152E137|nr:MULTISPECIES: LysR family transcriptional regulator [Methylobacterium]ACA21068.1 transcriptional regulator, LysR family [Methylobacterium sp. 4-46]WFT80217.1 LysR family transcriptional regulator [Methylobacterium nodulans]